MLYELIRRMYELSAVHFEMYALGRYGACSLCF